MFLVRYVFKFFLSFFYPKQYLSGRWFDKGWRGYIWGFKSIFHRSILRLGTPSPYPVGAFTTISNYSNVTFSNCDLNNFQSPGVYLQNFNAHIYIGMGSYIGPNVGIITANHSSIDITQHDNGQDVIIGNKCWIGMNAVIMPGVILGDHTIVGAGAIVTKSFPLGNTKIAGVPAKELKHI